MGGADGFGSEEIQTVRKYALQNSIEYDGNGKAGSVLGRVLAERADLRPRAKSLIELIEYEVEQANSLAKNQGLEIVRSELEAIDPEALERQKHQKKEGLPDLPGDTSNATQKKLSFRWLNAVSHILKVQPAPCHNTNGGEFGSPLISKFNLAPSSSSFTQLTHIKKAAQFISRRIS